MISVSRSVYTRAIFNGLLSFLPEHVFNSMAACEINIDPDPDQLFHIRDGLFMISNGDNTCSLLLWRENQTFSYINGLTGNSEHDANLRVYSYNAMDQSIRVEDNGNYFQMSVREPLLH